MMRKFVLALVLVCMGAGPALATTRGCSKDDVMTSFFMRQLQTDLMVASLMCSTENEYNAFIDRFGSVLKQNGKTLTASFRDRFGHRIFKNELNAFVTTLANLSSVDSVMAGQAYCETNRVAFQSILKLEPADIESFAQGWWDATRALPQSDCRRALTLQAQQ